MLDPCGQQTLGNFVAMIACGRHYTNHTSLTGKPGWPGLPGPVARPTKPPSASGCGPRSRAARAEADKVGRGVPMSGEALIFTL